MNMNLLDPVQRQEVERAGDLEHPQAPLCLVHRPEQKSHLSASSQGLFFRAYIVKELLRDKKLSLILGLTSAFHSVPNILPVHSAICVLQHR
jgi:hypothetical protein